MTRRVVDSPIGPLYITSDPDSITELKFRCQEGDEYSCGGGSATTALDLCEREVKAYFSGKLKEFTVPVRLTGTEFRMKVWEALRGISYGETVSYRDIAVRIGNAKAVRAVGGANHHNPVSIIVPCHRVVGADGSLTGFGGGLSAKEYLLGLEAKYK